MISQQTLNLKTSKLTTRDLRLTTHCAWPEMRKAIEQPPTEPQSSEFYAAILALSEYFPVQLQATFPAIDRAPFSLRQFQFVADETFESVPSDWQSGMNYKGATFPLEPSDAQSLYP